MKKFSHNKSIRLSISKNWSVIKKTYINKNIYSTENQLLIRIWDSFLFKLNIISDRIITKEFSRRLILIVPTLPLKHLNHCSNYLMRLSWITHSLSSLSEFPLFIHIKTINSPYLGVKLLNRIFNQQIKTSTLKESINDLKKKKFFATVQTSNLKFSLNHIFLIYSMFIHTIKISPSPCTQQYSKNKKINSHFKLKNKLFFQKFFSKLQFQSESLNLKVFLFLNLIDPSYNTVNKFLFNLWQLVRTSTKYNGDIQGLTLKFRGKLEKLPRKQKIKIYQGSLHRLNIKTNLKINNDNVFISNRGTNNVKFIINY